MAQIPTVEIVVNGRRKVVNADDPRAKGASHEKEAIRQEGRAQEVTRETVATMSGPELSELLKAHGVETIPRALADRRAMLTQILFVEF